MVTESDVLIAGAGPTGLMLALWLTRAGVGVRIVDPKSGPSPATRAIVVQARTLEFYDQLGLGAAALAHGRHFDAVSLWARGHLAGQLDLRQVATTVTPHPDVYILTQDQNEALLLAQLQTLGVSVAWETELTGFRQDATGVTATVQHGDHQETLHAAYLAGCDGAHSAVRQGMGVEFAGDTYPYTFYVADVTATGKLHPNDVNLGLDDQHFLAFFPMPGDNHHRVIGEIPADAGDQPTFADVRAEVEAHGLAQVEAVHWFAAYRLHHRVAPHFRVGHAFLLGDAGHVHTPVGGQGMNTGLGDAVNLAWKLAQVIHGGDAAILDSYEADRLPFAQALVKTTDRIFTGIVAPSGTARFLRTNVIPALFPLASRSAFLRRALFLTISQTRIAYPQSVLSQGQAGKIKGGDRLPWVPTNTGGNFAPLQSLQWQLHCYGTPSAAAQAWCDQRQLALHAFPFTAAAHQAGLARDGLYLVRPDGYVGLAASTFAPATFAAYADLWLPHEGG